MELETCMQAPKLQSIQSFKLAIRSKSLTYDFRKARSFNQIGLFSAAHLACGE